MLFAGFGCETIVEVDLPEHRPVLVANCLFGPDRIWSVQLYQSKERLARDRTIETVSNATVEIMDGDVVVASSGYIGDATYRARSNITPRIGRTYTLKASAPGFDPIEASDVVPVPVPINSVDVDTTSLPFKFTIHFKDPPDSKNYYQVMVLSPASANDTTSLVPVHFKTDDLIFRELGDVNTEEAVFDDSFISGKNYSLKLRAYPFGRNPIRQMYLVLFSLTESNYKYMMSKIFQEDREDNPFSMPVQIYNNIDNGLGIFAGYSISMVPAFYH